MDLVPRPHVRPQRRAGTRAAHRHLSAAGPPAGHAALAGWFFIRYWEGGPHVRLRLRDAQPEAAAQVREVLGRSLGALPNAGIPDPDTYYAAFVPPGQRAGAAGQYGWHPHGQVLAVPYEPETLRYGGPAGLEISEGFFETSSAFAAQILPLTPTRAARLGLGLHLLLTTVRALDLDTPGAVRWLRDFVNAWPLFSTTPTEQVARARERAEATYFASPPSLSGARQTYTQRPGRQLLQAWEAEVRAAHRAYRAVEGQLSYPSLDIWRSQLHMFHNRLGFSIEDECYLATLAALILSDRGASTCTPTGPRTTAPTRTASCTRTAWPSCAPPRHPSRAQCRTGRASAGWPCPARKRVT
ncbi:thiopeptide-type bacteriocin biosynthesis protein [Deinococcus multiflagellatus]|uniref:Thiopeptide-type bacteriocin biosynthesis protein n=1 Tax=Deinococcus multiflagellatus TaxID=1656887 RepID=A0ABW1ZMS5_9DEIO